VSKLTAVVKEMSAATQQATRALAAMSRSAARLSAQSTSTLYGVTGGFLGTGGAYALSLAFPVSLAAVGFILTGLGIVGGVLFYRGRRRIDIETRLDENRLASDEILRRIKLLPRDTPPHVREEMWLTYQALNSVQQFRRTVVAIPISRDAAEDTALLRAPQPPEAIPVTPQLDRNVKS
jgi:hypothetical protein